MDNLQEDNPLQTQNEIIATRVAIKLKNNVGRPKKKTEIKFSPQPKSIISEFLCNERKNLLENPTDDISSKTSVEEKNKRTCEDCSDGYRIVRYLIFINNFMFLTFSFYFQKYL